MKISDHEHKNRFEGISHICDDYVWGIQGYAYENGWFYLDKRTEITTIIVLHEKGNAEHSIITDGYIKRSKSIQSFDNTHPKYDYTVYEYRTID